MKNYAKYLCSFFCMIEKTPDQSIVVWVPEEEDRRTAIIDGPRMASTGINSYRKKSSNGIEQNRLISIGTDWNVSRYLNE